MTENGSKYEQCTVCGYQKEAIEIDKLAPDIIDGQNSSWEIESNDNLIFRSNALFSDFIAVSVDGDIIDASDYLIIDENNTVVELKYSFLEQLSVGWHTFDVISSNGTASTKFEVTETETTTEEETTEPATEKLTETTGKETTTKEETSKETTMKTENTIRNTSKKSPATGATAAPASIVLAAVCSIIIAAKKRNDD